MNIEELRLSCLAVKGSTESMPFTKHNILGFKVMDKIFAYLSLNPKDGVFRVKLKCDPEKSLELREEYQGITETEYKTPLWNLVSIESDVPDKVIEKLIFHSADEVVKKLSKTKREKYLNS